MYEYCFDEANMNNYCSSHIEISAFVGDYKSENRGMLIVFIGVNKTTKVQCLVVMFQRDTHRVIFDIFIFYYHLFIFYAIGY